MFNYNYCFLYLSVYIAFCLIYLDGDRWTEIIFVHQML